MPTAPDDADPFEGQRPVSHVMRLALFSLKLIKSLGPERVTYCFLGPLDKGLSKELGTTVSPMHPGFVP